MKHLRLLLDSEEGIDTGCQRCDAVFMSRYCRSALEMQSQVSITSNCVVEISVQLLGMQSMQQLNHQFRDKDAPTNVLSFNAGMPALEQKDGQSLLSLGDLVFCPEVIKQESQQQNKSLEEHWAHLLVHGSLHLCGFDHEVSSQASVMESLEIQILSGSGIADPYQVRPS